MSKQKVTIIDTGVANLSSVLFAMNRLDADCIISARENDIRNADKLILPGVGSAVAAMKSIRERHLDDLIVNVHQPLLGICLGMQMLASFSEESMSQGTDAVKCLGIVDGGVRLMKVPGLVLPHMGWDQVDHDGSCPLFKDIPSGSYFYYVHSYALDVTGHTAATTTYGQTFSAVVNRDNFFGTQFHPEKSGPIGHKLLKNFLDL